MNNYTKCTRKVAKCPSKIKKVIKAKKVSKKTIKSGDKYSGNAESCFEGKPYFLGTGYISRFVPLVRDDGVCVDCDSSNFRFHDETGKDFCFLDGLMRQAAANAFDKDSSCPYPQGISLKLKNFCFNNNRSLQFSALARYEGQYCGKKKTVYVRGGTGIGPDSYANVPESISWSYAT